jgi:hypothetical protein
MGQSGHHGLVMTKIARQIDYNHVVIALRQLNRDAQTVVGRAIIDKDNLVRIPSGNLRLRSDPRVKL